MGFYNDLGRPIVGGWLGGGWVTHDPVRDLDLLWGAEYGQEGAWLFAIDVDSGAIMEEHQIGCREFTATPDHETGKLWVATNHGLYQPGHLLLSWDPKTRELTSHGFPATADQRFAGSPLIGSEGNIYIGSHPHGHLFRFSSFEGVWKDCGCQAPDPIITGQHIWCYPRYESIHGEIICSITRDPAAQVAYNPETNQTRIISNELPAKPVFSNPVTREIKAEFRIKPNYTVDGKKKTSEYQPRVATDICGLNRGTDGAIYGSTIISMHVFRFDPETRDLSDLGRVGWGSGEVYDVIGHAGKVYMGSYGGGYWAVYDPEKPWNPLPEKEGIDPNSNPRNFGHLGADMNRPFEYTIGPDDNIYIACRANYRIPGGGMARFKPSTEEIFVFRDENQSIQSITSDEHYVYGGTSISGGRGCIETTTEGLLYLFDVSREKRIFECIPVPNAVAVTSLAVSTKSKLLYGSASNGQLFAFSIKERQVIHRWTMRSMGTPLMGVPETYGIIHLTCGVDGNIYGCTRTDVFQLDVSTHQINYLDTPPISDLYQIVEGKPGIFYIGARGHLLEYHLIDKPHYR